MYKTCPAILNIEGEHYTCDWPVNQETGDHKGLAHTNSAAKALWIGPEDDFGLVSPPS